MERKLREMMDKRDFHVWKWLDWIGFLETEIKKDGLPICDPEDNPDAPKPREMIDLEVSWR